LSSLGENRCFGILSVRSLGEKDILPPGGQEDVEKPGSGAGHGTITYARNALMATINQPQGSAVFKNWPCVTFV
jgi:hypothetical protein